MGYEQIIKCDYCDFKVNMKDWKSPNVGSSGIIHPVGRVKMSFDGMQFSGFAGLDDLEIKSKDICQTCFSKVSHDFEAIVKKLKNE